MAGKSEGCAKLGCPELKNDEDKDNKNKIKGFFVFSQIGQCQVLPTCLFVPCLLPKLCPNIEFDPSIPTQILQRQ